MDDVCNALSKLPWTGRIQGFHEKDESVTVLHTYATTTWLTTTHENQMLDLLAQDLLDYDGDGIEVVSTYFFQVLYNALVGKSDGRWVKRLGHSLGNGQQRYLATIVSSFGTHWVAIILDFGHGIVWHGDSLGWKLEDRIKTALDWFTHRYTSLKFSYQKLPITHQDDSFSCGLLAWNALSHFFLPAEHPLIEPTQVSLEGLKVLLRACAHQVKGSHLSI